MKLNYAQQIKHPEWQKKRLEVLELHEFQCQDCGDTETELNVHHPLYRRGAMIWQYELNELQCLCVKCHKNAHAIDDRLKIVLATMDGSDKNQILGYIETMAGNIKLYPNSYEYCLGVADYLSYNENTPPERNKRKDRVEGYFILNKGKDGSAVMDDYIMGAV